MRTGILRRSRATMRAPVSRLYTATKWTTTMGEHTTEREIMAALTCGIGYDFT